MKKIIVSIIAIFVLLCLVACGSSNSGKGGGTSTDNGGGETSSGGDNTIHRHSYGGWELVTFRGCTVASTGIEHCSECGKKRYTELVTGHTEAIIPAIDVTCESDGLTEGKWCSVCEEILEEQTIIPKGHIEGSGDGMCDRCGYYSEGLEYILSEDSTYYILSGIGDCEDLVVYVPNVYNDLPVKIVGEYAFCGLKRVTAIILPDSIETIQYSAFSGSYPLESIRFGNGLKRIDAEAFCGCVLSEVVLPEGLQIIGQGAFAECTELITVKLPESLQVIDPSAFSNCTSLESVVFPNNCQITRLDSTFYGCTSLKSISIPDSVNRLNGTFCRCSSLYEVVLVRNLEIIEEYSFRECGRLKNITIPASVKYIEAGAFFETKLSSVNFENPYDWISSYNGKEMGISAKDMADPTYMAKWLDTVYYTYKRVEE